MHRVSPRTHASFKYLLAVRGRFTAEKIKSEMLRLITNAVVACRLSLVYFNSAITVTKLPNTPIMLNIIAQAAAMMVTNRANGLKSPSPEAISKIVSFAAKCSIFQQIRRSSFLRILRKIKDRCDSRAISRGNSSRPLHAIKRFNFPSTRARLHFPHYFFFHSLVSICSINSMEFSRRGKKGRSTRPSRRYIDSIF